MDYLLIAFTALLASGLTFFSGFGLGTILLPAFALFFSLEEAIALTAIVHFLNNLFKLSLIGKYATLKVLLKFGIPAVLFAYVGAKFLQQIENSVLFSHTFFGSETDVYLQQFIVALLIFFFSLFDLLPRLKRIQFSDRFLPIGGVLSGFFGGFSGHQGALRSAFLIKAGLSKEAFIATGIAIACFIDITRISVYTSRLSNSLTEQSVNLLLTALLAAFVGAFFGRKMLVKTTIDTLQTIVGVGMILIAFAIGLGAI
jgi:hypothetical protein